MKLLNVFFCLFAATLVSCASQEAVRKKVAEMEVGPSENPRRSITNFSEGLRCMDNTLIEHGVRDVLIIVEDLEDKTSKVKAGTKDMLITAVSNMTRRSRAVKLIAFGNDSGNVIGFLGNAGSQSVYNIIPQYGIRGSISQLDKSVVSQQSGISLAGDKWGVGGSKSVNASILGIDLSVLSTQDLSVVAGVTSSNTVVLFKSGKGADADATIEKVGVSFDFTVSRSEATIQALRNLIELASIELIGKLVKVPYWKCLGIPETSAEIQQEMADWYYSMTAHGELIPYVRSLLIARNYYPDTVTDETSALLSALNRFQESIGSPTSNNIEYNVFSALMNGEASQLATTSVSPPDSNNDQSTRPVDDVSTTKSAEPLSIELSSANETVYFRPGETISLTARSNESAYVYCYLTDSSQKTQRFFPNRFQKNNYLKAGSELKLPGNMPFDIVADENGKEETFSCFATRRDAYSQLPKHLKVYDFEDMPNTTINDIRNGYRTAAGNIGEAQFVVGSTREGQHND